MSVMFNAVLFLALLTGTTNAQPDRFGTPACDAPTQTMASRTAFTLCFDSSTKVATWAAYELTPEHLESFAAPRPSHFRRDPALADSAADLDYRNSGFDRGHLVPARDVAYSPAALAESFFLSNAAPQVPSVNRGSLRRVEESIRSEASHSQAVYVITGTLYDCSPEVTRIGPNNVAVPCAFFKAMLTVTRETMKLRGVLISNEAHAEPTEVSVAELERRTGLRFFPKTTVQ